MTRVTRARRVAAVAAAADPGGWLGWSAGRPGRGSAVGLEFGIWQEPGPSRRAGGVFFVRWGSGEGSVVAQHVPREGERWRGVCKIGAETARETSRELDCAGVRGRIPSPRNRTRPRLAAGAGGSGEAERKRGMSKAFRGCGRNLDNRRRTNVPRRWRDAADVNRPLCILPGLGGDCGREKTETKVSLVR